MKVDLQTLARVLVRKGIVTEADLVSDAAREEVVSFAPAEALARVTAADAVKGATLDDETVAALAPLWPTWAVGEAVDVGDLRAFDGTLVECLQAHTTQADWTPTATPALWKVHRKGSGAQQGEAPAAWVQPTGAHDAYNTGDRVTFQGGVYESLIDANVWSPTEYPQGWKLIE